MIGNRTVWSDVKHNKKHMFFYFCILSIIFCNFFAIKCHASCNINHYSEKTGKNASIMTNSVNGSEKENSDYFISVWNDTYMEDIFKKYRAYVEKINPEYKDAAIFDAENLWEKILAGDFIEVLYGVGSNMVRYVKNMMNGVRNMIWDILILSICSSLYFVFIDVIKNEQVAQIGAYIIYMLGISRFAMIFYSQYKIAESMLYHILEFAKILLPAYASVLGISNGFYTSAAYYEGILALVWIVESVLCKFVLPAILVYLCIILMEGIGHNEGLKMIRQNMNKGIKLILKVILWIVGSVGALQAIITPVIDSLEWKTSKKVMEMIPGLGDISAGISDLFFSSMILIRNSIGCLFTILLFAVSIAPVIRICCVALVMKATASVTSLLQQNTVSKLADQVADASFLVCSVLFTGTGLFFLSLAITMLGTVR